MAKVGFGLAESQTCFLIGYQWQPIEIPSKADFTKLAQNLCRYDQHFFEKSK